MADAYTAADLIEARLRAAWTATPQARLRFDNGPLIDMAELGPFCQAEIIGGSDRPYIGQPGNRLHRMEGVVMLNLMAPVGEGRAAIAAMHRNARAALSNAVFDGVYMDTIIPNRGRPGVDDGSYYGVTSVLPFAYLYFAAA